MKRILILVLSLLLCPLLFAQPVLKKVYHYDYGPVTRMVLAFDRMPEYRFSSDPDGHRITVTLSACQVTDGLAGARSTGGPVLESVNVERTGAGASVTITTRQRFSLDPFTIQDGVNKIVLDVYNSKSPANSADILALARFYYLVHFYPRAIDYYQQVERDHPELTQIHYYWGKILQETGHGEEASTHFARVGNDTDEYKASRREQSRAPQKKTATMTEPEPVRVKPQPAEPRTPPAGKQPARPPAAKPGAEPVTPPPIPSEEAGNRTEPISGLDSLGVRYLNYYLNAGEFPRQLFLLAQVATTSGDYATAIRYFEEAVNLTDSKSPRFAEIHRGLAECYSALGMQDKAKLHRAYVAQSAPQSNKGLPFYMIPLPLWLALGMAAGASLIVLFFSVIHHRRQVPDHFHVFDEQDVEPERISEGYRQTYDRPEPEPEPEFTRPEPPKPEPEPEASSFDVYRPPLIAEELTPEEDAELDRLDSRPAQYESVNYDALQKGSDNFQGFGEGDYRTKMIRKLSQDGWDAEAIAKELQISQNEVDFVLKMG